MEGTPRNTVAPCSPMARATWAGSKRGRGTKEKPCSRGVSMPTVAAKAWNMGSTTRRRSSSESSRAAVTLSVLETRLACVSMAPLGRPVVPEV